MEENKKAVKSGKARSGLFVRFISQTHQKMLNLWIKLSSDKDKKFHFTVCPLTVLNLFKVTHLHCWHSQCHKTPYCITCTIKVFSVFSITAVGSVLRHIFKYCRGYCITDYIRYTKTAGSGAEILSVVMLTLLSNHTTFTQNNSFCTLCFETSVNNCSAYSCSE